MAKITPMIMSLSPTNKNIIANFYKILVVFINQILLVPAYLKYLGLELYGDWIVLTAVTGFFTMSDIGLGNAVSNRFSIEYAKGKVDFCNLLLNNNFFFVFTTLFILSSLFISVTYFVDIFKFLGLNAIMPNDARLICIFFLLQIMALMLDGVFNSIYIACHLAYKVTFLGNTARLISALFIIIGLVSGFSLSFLVLFSSIPYFALIIYKIIDSRNYFKYKIKLRFVDKKVIIDLIKPSFAFMCFPLGNAVLFQGFTVVVNHFLGSYCLVQFNTMRTMTNFLRNISQAISAGIKPEFSIAYGKQDYTLMRKLYNKSWRLCTIAIIIPTLIIVFCGEWIYMTWTHGDIQYNGTLVFLLCVSLFFNMIWESTCISLTSTNNHLRFSAIYVISSLFVIFLAFCCGVIGTNIYILTICFVMSDIIMAITSIIMSNSLLNKKIKK